jgi:transcriptional regulator with XRE-family HTH domain
MIMARKKKEFNKNGTFQKRFTDLWYKSGKTQEQLAKALGVTRPTVVGWSDGRNLPDIESLERITKLFGVSADYLLGLSDTVSPDVSLRAAVAYTGLSEVAVERLHMGFEDVGYAGYGLSDEERNENRSTVSALIESQAFERMIQSLGQVAKWAYLENALVKLHVQYPKCDPAIVAPDVYTSSEATRKTMAANLIRILESEKIFCEEVELLKARSKIEASLVVDVMQILVEIRETGDHHQFLATKAFYSYLDQVVKDNHQKASKRFLKE